MQIPTFDGDIGQFKEWWQQYSIAVDKQPIENVLKLAHLKSCFNGIAAATIARFQLTNENYSAIVKLLHEKFGNEEKIIDNLTRQLYLVKPATSYKEVRPTFKKIDGLIRQLQLPIGDIDSRMIRMHLMSKFRRWIVVKLEEEKARSRHWTLDKLRRTMHNILDTQDNANEHCSK